MHTFGSPMFNTTYLLAYSAWSQHVQYLRRSFPLGRYYFISNTRPKDDITPRMTNRITLIPIRERLQKLPVTRSKGFNAESSMVSLQPPPSLALLALALGIDLCAVLRPSYELEISYVFFGISGRKRV